MLDSTSPDTFAPGYCDRNASVIAFLVLSSLTFFLSTVLVPLRVYVRVWIVKSFWWDDGFLVAAYLVLIPTYALLWQTVTDGLGRHLGCVSQDAAVQATKYQYIAEVLEIVCVVFSRTSVALFVVRLFGVTRPLRIFLYSYTLFMATSLLTTAGLVLAVCSPVQALWDPAVAATATCWSETVRETIDYLNGAISILSDFLLALLPIYFLIKLQMSRRLKVGLVLLLALGLLPALSAVLRTALASTQASSDFLYSSAVLIVFGSLETSIIIITTCLPALRPLFNRSTHQKSSEYSYNFKIPSESSRNLAGGRIESQGQTSIRMSPMNDAGLYGEHGHHNAATGQSYFSQ
ncbi:hypothetical protein F4777DRAFT_599137 [Nemania sp. FL0916]|nr:hypothetical protein F4777DRAFT_599137 [Nemania sp. FL0916]